jgi:hypothetical protein
VKGGDYSEELCVDGKINIRTNRREIVWESVVWLHLGQDMD